LAGVARAWLQARPDVGPVFPLPAARPASAQVSEQVSAAEAPAFLPADAGVVRVARVAQVVWAQALPLAVRVEPDARVELASRPVRPAWVRGVPAELALLQRACFQPAWLRRVGPVAPVVERLVVRPQAEPAWRARVAERLVVRPQAELAGQALVPRDA
jgi:hypothetical protein